MIEIAYRKGCVFKRFRDHNDFLDKIKGIGISKLTLSFKMNLVKLLDRFPKLKKFT